MILFTLSERFFLLKGLLLIFTQTVKFYQYKVLIVLFYYLGVEKEIEVVNRGMLIIVVYDLSLSVIYNNEDIVNFDSV